MSDKVVIVEWTGDGFEVFENYRAAYHAVMKEYLKVLQESYSDVNDWDVRNIVDSLETLGKHDYIENLCYIDEYEVHSERETCSDC